MEPLQFVYWLQGFMELSGTNEINATQTQIIKEHISLVLNKVTPSINIDKEIERVKFEINGKKMLCDVKDFPVTYIHQGSC